MGEARHLDDFAAVRAELGDGGLVSRSSWEPGVFLYLVPGSIFRVNRPPLLGIYPEGTEVTYRQHVDIRMADGTCAPWQPSQEAILADDWVALGTREAPS